MKSRKRPRRAAYRRGKVELAKITDHRFKPWDGCYGEVCRYILAGDEGPGPCGQPKERHAS